MPVGEAQKELSRMLLQVCQTQDSHLNYIQSAVRKVGKGVAIYCVHDFYTQYALSAGPLAAKLQAFIDDWSEELRAKNVVRVGVYGTGEYASGSWFDLKK
jgi:hypothetical protein